MAHEVELVTTVERPTAVVARETTWAEFPTLWKTLRMDPVKLEPAEMVVVHHRRGRVLATETHHVR